MKINNKTVLITGASSGIGKALAKLFAKERNKLILIARRTEKLEELKDELSGNNGEIYLYKCDVSNSSEVSNTFADIKTNFDSIDIAIFNAGQSYLMSVKNFDSHKAEAIIGTNFFGIVYPLEQLLPLFLERKSGTIVGVSSLADNRGFAGSGFYCASKAAVSVYLEGLSVELKKYNVKVITVKPGFVKTAMTAKNNFPMPMLMPVDKAASIIFNGIKKGKRIIQFPLPMVISSRLIGLLPAGIYEFLASKFDRKRK